jgi:redox-sensitive bicupin YhaK (pirin superfamily)
MIFHRRSGTRGHADHGWLSSYHTFSFADYYDPKFMGFSVLRVINEDWIAGGTGFPTHGHKDMEIITYMVEGVLEHKDTLGNAELLRAGEVQRMTAGRGIRHSEFNHRKDSSVHLVQIWLLPEAPNLEPSYEQRSFLQEMAKGELTLLVSPTGENNSLKIHQDVRLFAQITANALTQTQELIAKRNYYLHLIKGELNVNTVAMVPGDGLSVQNETQLQLQASSGCEFLLFDLPN